MDIHVMAKKFRELKAKAKEMLDNGQVNKDEFIKSIRLNRQKLASKGRLLYRNEVTEAEMIVVLANRNLRV